MSPRTKEQFQAMKDATRERILDTGLMLFAKSGLDAVNVTQIAREAGISLGLLYHYFPSKEELFSALVQMAVTGAMEALSSCEAEDVPPPAKIHRISKMVSSTLTKDNQTAYYFLLLLQAGLAANTQGVSSKPPIDMSFMAAPFDYLQGVILAGQQTEDVKPGDPGKLAQLYWAAFQGLCLYKITMRRFSPPDAWMLSGMLLTQKGCATIHED